MQLKFICSLLLIVVHSVPWTLPYVVASFHVSSWVASSEIHGLIASARPFCSIQSGIQLSVHSPSRSNHCSLGQGCAARHPHLLTPLTHQATTRHFIPACYPLLLIASVCTCVVYTISIDFTRPCHLPYITSTYVCVVFISHRTRMNAALTIYILVFLNSYTALLCFTSRPQFMIYSKFVPCCTLLLKVSQQEHVWFKVAPQYPAYKKSHAAALIHRNLTQSEKSDMSALNKFQLMHKSSTHS